MLEVIHICNYYCQYASVFACFAEYFWRQWNSTIICSHFRNPKPGSPGTALRLSWLTSWRLHQPARAGTTQLTANSTTNAPLFRFFTTIQDKEDQVHIATSLASLGLPSAKKAWAISNQDRIKAIIAKGYTPATLPQYLRRLGIVLNCYQPQRNWIKPSLFIVLLLFFS